MKITKTGIKTRDLVQRYSDNRGEVYRYVESCVSVMLIRDIKRKIEVSVHN